MLVSGCSYRYGTNSFVIGDGPPEAKPTYVETTPTVESPVTVVTTVKPEPCKTESNKMVIVNKLNSKDNTIETTAESTRTEHKTIPCE